MSKLSEHIFWIDFVEGDSLMDRIHDLEQPGTQDELGLGRIRDYFADSFFPGTTTVMTRARYFLFIPAIYYFYERSGEKVGIDKIKRKQNELRERLETYRKNHRNKVSADSYGIIGSVSKERLKRWPDSIYWNGITKLGIFTKKEWSRSYYLNVINRREKRLYDDDNNAQDDSLQLNAWDFRYDEFKKFYFLKDNIFKDDEDGMPLELFKSEALYLREKLSSQADSLYQFLINQKREYGEGIFWEIPGLPRFDDVKDAKNFSFLGKGLWLSYYFFLSKKKKNGKEDYFYDLFKKWYRATNRELKKWDYGSFINKHQKVIYFNKPVIRSSDFSFLTDTYHNMFKFSSNTSLMLQKNEIHIKNRERFVKGDVRAKLFNDKAMEEWDGKIETSEDHLYEYDYRWQRPVRTIINDVIRGLKRV